MNCSIRCQFGCFNETICLPCPISNCEVCNNLIPETCHKCKVGYVLNNGRCKICLDSEYYNETTENCLACPTLCKSCLNESYCIECINNSNISNNFFCEHN